jgi:hypothetical protein
VGPAFLVGLGPGDLSVAVDPSRRVRSSGTGSGQPGLIQNLPRERHPNWRTLKRWSHHWRPGGPIPLAGDTHITRLLLPHPCS